MFIAGTLSYGTATSLVEIRTRNGLTTFGDAELLGALRQQRSCQDAHQRSVCKASRLSPVVYLLFRVDISILSLCDLVVVHFRFLPVLELNIMPLADAEISTRNKR